MHKLTNLLLLVSGLLLIYQLFNVHKLRSNLNTCNDNTQKMVEEVQDHKGSVELLQIENYSCVSQLNKCDTDLQILKSLCVENH